jgi:hypothetical protein
MRRTGEFTSVFRRVAQVAAALVVPLSMAAGCSASAPDSRFSAQTNDEYQEPLTNAIIGSPSGVTAIPPATLPSAEQISLAVGGSTSSGGSSSGSFGGNSSSSSFGGSSSSSTGVVFGPDGGVIGPEGGAGGGGGGFGFWHFDDCSPTSNFLVDSSGEGANAQHALGGSCVPGISGSGVQLRTAKDVVQVPDEPQFTVGQRVGVAAWVHPTTVTGDQPIIIKRLNGQTAFSLGIHNGNIEMSVVLTTGTTVISRAPIQPGVWSHVGGLFDGTFVFLFINGQQFGQTFGAGTIQNVFAPVRIGATTQTQFFNGIIDEVFVSTQPLAPSDIEALACIHNPSTFSVNPLVGAPVPFDTASHFDVTVNDNDVGLCQPATYEAFQGNFDPNVTFQISPSFAQTAPGTSIDIGVDVTASENANPGSFLETLDVERFDSIFEFLQPQFTFNLAQPTGCFVSTPRELMITDLSVVEDPVRTFGAGVSQGSFGDGGIGVTSTTSFTTSTTFAGGGATGSGGSASLGGGPLPPPIGVGGFTSTTSTSVGSTTFGGGSSGSSGGFGGGVDASTPVTVDPNDPNLGAWTFGHLMRQMAPTEEQAPAMVEQLFDTWLSDQQINGFTVAARPGIQQVVFDVWPRTANGQLDLDHPPLRLQAIVNRLDLRDLSSGSAGEGRFVFAFDSSSGFPQQFTVILEYNLPARTQQDALSSHPFPSEEYNVALQAITDKITGRGNALDPNAVNGNNLHQLRTNEIATSFRWELREFVLSAATGFLQEQTVRETPDLSFLNTTTLGTFINSNATAISAELPGFNGNTIPATLNGAPFRAGSVFNDFIEWNAPNVASDDARFHMSINTCNGCHGPETNTSFLQITPRFPGSTATLSPFLTGTTVFDTNGQSRTLNDLARRRTDLTSFVCADAGTSPPPPPPQDAGAAFDGAIGK